MRQMFLIGAALMAAGAMSLAPAGAAVSQKVRQACEKKADLVRPALRADEREAFIANCLADATATPRKDKYKDGY